MRQEKIKVLLWLAWVMACAGFIFISAQNMLRYPAGQTSDVYEINRLASLRITRMCNPYPETFLIRTRGQIYGLRYDYPPAGALVYALFSAWTDIRWANCLLGLICAFSLVLIFHQRWFGFLISAVFLLNPWTQNAVSGMTSSSEVIGAGLLFISLLSSERFRVPFLSAAVLALCVLIKQFYFPLGILFAVYFFRTDKKLFCVFFLTASAVCVPFIVFSPAGFFSLISSQSRILSAALTQHFYAPWMFSSPSLFYRIYAAGNWHAAVLITIAYLSGCAVSFVYFIENVWRKKVDFSGIVFWFGVWLLAVIFGIPKLNFSQYVFLLLPSFSLIPRQIALRGRK